MNQRIKATVNLDKIRNNFEYLQSLAGNGRVLCVVKADAYGHGAVAVCSYLEKCGADFFAVACIEEALELRNGGIKSDIMVLGITDTAYSQTLLDKNLVQIVDSYDYASSLPAGTRVHIKIDTGMSRLGIYCHSSDDIAPCSEEIKKIHSLDIKCEGICTHFADADGTKTDFTYRQFDIFHKLLETLSHYGVSAGIRHCCNSAAALRFPEMRLDMIRSGLALYGLSPVTGLGSALSPAMTLSARVSAVKALKKGDSVSYGCKYTAKKDMLAAVISAGYADGLSRLLSGKAIVKINGAECRLVGNICMDLCVADVTGADCRAGDKAIIFDSAESINLIASQMGTISYEILCMLKKRVYMEYVSIKKKHK